MAEKTTNYNLSKPADNETADIASINGNMDILDTELKKNADEVSQLNDSLNGEIGNRQTAVSGEATARVAADTVLQNNINAKAAATHYHDAGYINSGILPVARGGTGVGDMVGADYTTNRPRGIVLQASMPGAVANGCIVGVYK